MLVWLKYQKYPFWPAVVRKHFHLTPFVLCSQQWDLGKCVYYFIIAGEMIGL